MYGIKSSKAIQAELPWIVVTPSSVQLLYVLHVFLVKCEFSNIWIFFHSLRLNALWDHSQSLLNGPSQNHLMGCSVMFLGDLHDFFIFINWFFFLLIGKTYLKVGTGPEARITGHLNSFLSGISDHLLLIEFWMYFSLVHWRFDLASVN